MLCKFVQRSLSSVIVLARELSERLDAVISVNMVEADVYEVVVGQRVGSALQRGEVNITEETIHRVHMSQAYYRKLCGATTTHEWVLLNAFQFLLEREPNTAILKVFDLSDVGRYFPEFESEMQLRLGYWGAKDS
jgi:hypothetical protein